MRLVAFGRDDPEVKEKLTEIADRVFFAEARLTLRLGSDHQLTTELNELVELLSVWQSKAFADGDEAEVKAAARAAIEESRAYASRAKSFVAAQL